MRLCDIIGHKVCKDYTCFDYSKNTYSYFCKYCKKEIAKDSKGKWIRIK